MKDESEETDWTDFAADIAKLRAHRPQDPMPRLGRQGKPAENKPRKEKPVRDVMHPSDKTCEAWSKLTPNRLTDEQAKAVSDWQEIRTTRKQREAQGERTRQRILRYWTQFMILNDRQPTLREAKAALHISNGALTRHLEKLSKENKLPAARKPGGMKTTGKETIMTDKKPTTAENDKANEKTGAEDYKDYGNPVRQLERYITILDDFANETIRIRRASYEAIKNDDCFVFAEHDFLNDILKTRRSMTALLKALKAKENQQ